MTPMTLNIGWARAACLSTLASLLCGSMANCGGGSGTGATGPGMNGDDGAQALPVDGAWAEGTAFPDDSGAAEATVGSVGTDDSGAGQAGGSREGSHDTGRSQSAGDVANTTSGDGSATVGPESGDGGPMASGALSFAADRVIVTGVRNTTTPAATGLIQFHNDGPTVVQVNGLAVGGPDGALFRVTASAALPAMVGPGANLPVTIQLITNGATLPAAPTNKDLGSTLLSATVTATLRSGAATTASVWGLVLIQNNWEPTLGQILQTLGFKLNVGAAQNNWNPNVSMVATNLPGIEAGTDEVAAPHFVKAGPGNVTMTVVARFSPVGVLPYGWYPSASSSTHNVVGTMSMSPDGQTSDKARMVYPPLAPGSATTFDPGTSPFGIWVYSDQATQKYATGHATNGDYDYTQDALNLPAGVHRIKTYPLKDASGARVAQSYLIAVEEATNGDYQDYVFALGNVNAAP